MSRLPRIFLYSLFAVALLGGGLPSVAHAACSQHQQKTACDCCSAQQTPSCEALCQARDPGAGWAVLAQDAPKPQQRARLQKVQPDAQLAVIAGRLQPGSVLFFGSSPPIGSSHLYLQSHNLRL